MLRFPGIAVLALAMGASVLAQQPAQKPAQRLMLETIGRRAKRELLSNVKKILGTTSDPHLPPGLHAVLMVDTYTHLNEPLQLLKHIREALAPNGRLGIVDFKTDGAGGPGPPLEQRLPAETIKKQVAQAGLKLVSEENFLRYQYMLTFGK